MTENANKKHKDLINIAKNSILSLSEKELEMVLAILKSEKEGESC